MESPTGSTFGPTTGPNQSYDINCVGLRALTLEIFNFNGVATTFNLSGIRAGGIPINMWYANQYPIANFTTVSINFQREAGGPLQVSTFLLAAGTIVTQFHLPDILIVDLPLAAMYLQWSGIRY